MSEKKSRTEYFQGYYRERKEELSEKRKELYHSDPEHRAKVKKASRDYRARKKEKIAQLRAEGKLPPARSGLKGPRKPVTVVIDGEECQAYTITIVAQRLERSINTINYWAKVGLLPETPLRSRRGDRLYTDAMILIMRLAVYKRGRVSLKDDTFCQEIIDGWKEFGVFNG